LHSQHKPEKYRLQHEGNTAARGEGEREGERERLQGYQDSGCVSRKEMKNNERRMVKKVE
jgi:hypothetical protein